jgi:hypothetical protein
MQRSRNRSGAASHRSTEWRHRARREVDHNPSQGDPIARGPNVNKQPISVVLSRCLVPLLRLSRSALLGTTTLTPAQLNSASSPCKAIVCNRLQFPFRLHIPLCIKSHSNNTVRIINGVAFSIQYKGIEGIRQH